MNIIITRLLTGEEVLGEVEMTDDKFCVIKNPTTISAAPNPHTKNVDIHMGPWAPLSADKIVKISILAISCQYSPVTEIANKYRSMFGSGIIVPDRGLSTL